MTATYPVTRILCQRRSEGSLLKARTDGYRVGLAVEDGGMCGIVSGAMMAALMNCELERCFDAIYAFSSGAANSVYFLAGLGWYALSIYYDDLISRAFFDLCRAPRSQPD